MVNDRLPSALEAAFTRPTGGTLPAINGDVKSTPNGAASSIASLETDEWPERPVARVNSVEPGSPASESVSLTRLRRYDIKADE